jgi:hypothetical protein
VDSNDGATGPALVEALARLGIPSVIVSSEASLVPANSPALASLEKPFSATIIAATLKSLDLPRSLAS